MKTNEETTISEEQVLFNKLNYEDQQFILKQMRMLQPCELIGCELEEGKKIPEKLEKKLIYTREPNGFEHPDSELPSAEEFFNKINEIIDYLDYLKSKGDE